MQKVKKVQLIVMTFVTTIQKENILSEGKQDLTILVWELALWQVTRQGNPPNPTLKQKEIINGNCHINNSSSNSTTNPPPPQKKKKNPKQGSKKLGHVHSLLEPGPTKIYFVQILIIVIHKWGICNSNKMGITFWKNNQDWWIE